MAMKVPGVEPYAMAEHPLADAQARGGTPPAHAPTEAERRPPDAAEIRAAMDTLDKGFQLLNRRLQIRMDDDIGRVVIKVIDRETDKVIKEIPPAEIQQMAAKMREMIGLLVDEKI